MFEFELPGGIDTLNQLEAELLEYLGFGKADSFPKGKYEAVAKNVWSRRIRKKIDEE